MKINIVLPVYNEELRIKKGIDTLLDYLDKHREIDCVITIVDNGSTDQTEQIALFYQERYEIINYKKIREKGVGIAFKTAVRDNDCEVIGYMDIDMSTDIDELGEVWNIFTNNRQIDIINATRYSENSEVIGRTKARNFVSACCVAFLKRQLGMKSSDAICGFKFFRKEIIEQLVNESSNETPYILGRLFSVLESIQKDANPGVNTTIRDRYFNSACATPASVFPVLIKLKNSHIKKLEREIGGGSKIYYEKLLTELMEKINAFPQRLSLEEQGKFMLGYYHQTQKKYEKREDK